MAATQEHLLIKDVHDDIVLLKNGDMAVVLKTSAVNFGLLSDNEQYAIISSFAGMLNSLSFAIQIVIRSKRLDITHYLDSLKVAQEKQTNSLLYQMIDRYRSFIREIVRENEVLDKQFYIVIPLSYLEIGLSKNTESSFKKALTILLPRRDHIIRQLARCGIRSDQLTSDELIKLFYDVYNGQLEAVNPNKLLANTPAPAPKAPAAPTQPVSQTPSSSVAPAKTGSPKTDPVLGQRTAPIQQPVQPQPAPRPSPQQPAPAQTRPAQPMQPQRRNPFVVEELPDDYGTV